MKKLKLIGIMLLFTFLLTGCDLFKMDNMDNITIVTTNYPLEYLTTKLYGEHSLVRSMYPDGVNINKYEINKQMINNLSEEDLFIYYSFGQDKDIAVKLLNKNKNLLIIDGSLGMKPDYLEELWLNPSNMLMTAQNIKTGLNQYINNAVLKKQIETNYETILLELSELDAEMKLTGENATSKTIVTANKELNFLEKYGFNVISLDDDNTAIEKTIKEVNEMANNGQIKFIFKLQYDENSEVVNNLIGNNTNLELKELKCVSNISTEDRDAGFDYIQIMQDNLDLIKLETYK